MVARHAGDAVSGASDSHFRCLKRRVIGGSKAAIFGERRDRSVSLIAGYKAADFGQFLKAGRYEAYGFEAVSSSLFSEPFSGIALAFITELRK